MAKYNDIVVTNNGLDMIAESETAKPLIFTKIQLGDGQLTEVDDIKQFTALKHPCMNGVIHDIETGTAHGQATIVSIIDNSTLDKGFLQGKSASLLKLEQTEPKNSMLIRMAETMSTICRIKQRRYRKTRSLLH